MAQTHSYAVSGDRSSRRRDEPDAMLTLLGRFGPQTDSEAFAVLRRSFPTAPLCERVAAVSRWRAG